jgi:sodium-dependent dicarboxylate transporter 2/3/5
MSAPAEDGSTQDRVNEIIAKVETEAAPREEDWLARYPDLAPELAAYFDNRRWALSNLSLPHEPLRKFFGDYEVLEKLGEGGMGVVYKARQKGFNHCVAIKTIKGGQLATADDLRRFRREAEYAARLRHANIVTIHAVGGHEGLPFFSMEYVDGKSLAYRIREKPLPPKQAAEYLVRIADAVSHAHQHNVLHRDLKPSNILIDSEEQPRITDFGLAKLVGQSSQLTQGTAVLGTVSYMPPEQAEGRIDDIDERSDVYSLGAVLYEAITGKPPFRGDNAIETLEQVIRARPLAPRFLVPDVPMDVEAISLKCLEKDPRKRYGSAKELAEDLRRFLRGEPVLASGYDSVWWRFRTAAARLKIRTANIGLVAGPILALWIGLSAPLGRHASSARTSANAMAAVAALMIVWWLTEAIPAPATAFLPLILFPLLNIMPAAEAAKPYLDDVILGFLGGFLIVIALEESGLIRRVAFRMMALIGDDPRRMVLGFIAATAAISMWVSNTAATLMMLPIALSVLAKVEENSERSARARNLGTALLLGIAYAATIGGIGTLVGTPGNQRFRNMWEAAIGSGRILTFVGWMSMGVPVVLLLGFAAWILLAYRLFPVGSRPLFGRDQILKELDRMGPMTNAERRMIAICVVTVLLWIFREPVRGWGWAPGLGLASRVSDGTIAMSMALVCFLLPANRERGKRLLEWELTRRLPWGVLFLFGGGLALGRGMQAAGLDGYLADKLGAVLQALPFGKLAAASTFVAVLALVMPIVATVETAFPVLIGMAKKLSLDAGPFLIAAMVSATCHFLLPASTPPNAIVYGTGKVAVRDMIKAGMCLIPVGIVIAVPPDSAV